MSLLKSAFSVSFFTLLSRITGLGREIMTASLFGAGGLMDAFFVAFRLPNLLRRLFAEGAFSQAFVPLLMAYKTEKPEQLKEWLSHIATLLFWTLSIITVLGVVFMSFIVQGLAGHLPTKDIAVKLGQIMFPYVGFISLTAMASGILNTFNCFKIPAFSPVLLNLIFLACGYLLTPKFGIMSLGYAVLLGGAAQLFIHIPFLRKYKVLPSIYFTSNKIKQSFNYEGVQELFQKMAPAVFGVSIAQISLLINTKIAASLGEGRTSWLSYADRLMEFPTALLGVALGTVLIPKLSHSFVKKDTVEFNKLLDWGIRLVSVLALPCALALWFLSEPLVACLFYRGKFSLEDVRQTAQAVQCYGVGLFGLILIKILAPCFYSRQDTRTPAKIGIISLILTQLFNVIFIMMLDLGHAGLSLSIGLGALCNCVMLFVILKKQKIYTSEYAWSFFLAKLIIGLLILSSIFYMANYWIDWLALGAFNRWILLFFIGCGGVIIYLVSLFLMGIRRRELWY